MTTRGSGGRFVAEAGIDEGKGEGEEVPAHFHRGGGAGQPGAGAGHWGARPVAGRRVRRIQRRLGVGASGAVVHGRDQRRPRPGRPAARAVRESRCPYSRDPGGREWRAVRRRPGERVRGASERHRRVYLDLRAAQPDGAQHRRCPVRGGPVRPEQRRQWRPLRLGRHGRKSLPGRDAPLQLGRRRQLDRGGPELRLELQDLRRGLDRARDHDRLRPRGPDLRPHRDLQLLLLGGRLELRVQARRRGLCRLRLPQHHPVPHGRLPHLLRSRHGPGRQPGLDAGLSHHLRPNRRGSRLGHHPRGHGRDGGQGQPGDHPSRRLDPAGRRLPERRLHGLRRSRGTGVYPEAATPGPTAPPPGSP